MTADVLNQAANIKALVSAGVGARVGLAHFEAALDCAERLVRTGKPLEAVELVDSVVPMVPDGAHRYLIRLEVQALRGLYTAFWDSACFERASRSLVSMRYLSDSLPLEYAQLRIYQAVALSRMNRVDEAIAQLEAIALTLRERPESHALCQCMVG